MLAVEEEVSVGGADRTAHRLVSDELIAVQPAERDACRWKRQLLLERVAQRRHVDGRDAAALEVENLQPEMVSRSPEMARDGPSSALSQVEDVGRDRLVLPPAPVRLLTA